DCAAATLVIADRYCPPMMRPFLFCCGDVTPTGRAGTNRSRLRVMRTSCARAPSQRTCLWTRPWRCCSRQPLVGEGERESESLKQARGGGFQEQGQGRNQLVFE